MTSQDESEYAQSQQLDNATLEDAKKMAESMKVEIADGELEAVVDTANNYARKGKAKGSAMEAVIRFLKSQKE